MSWKTFSAVWAKYKPVCFFIYVNHYHFNGKLLLNPKQTDFAASVDKLLSDQEGLERFLRQSLFVRNKLQEVLYRSAWEGVHTPEFPYALKSLSVPTREPDEKMRAVMAQYSRH